MAWFYPADEFAVLVTNWCRQQAADFCWNSLLRLELRHNLRRMRGNYGALAWRAHRGSETSNRLRMGIEGLADLLESGNELSARLAAQTTAGTWDCVHVAAAQHNRDEAFAACDAAQAALARLANFSKVQLLARPADLGRVVSPTMERIRSGF